MRERAGGGDRTAERGGRMDFDARVEWDRMPS
jgi:hypothetical protein